MPPHGAYDVEFRELGNEFERELGAIPPIDRHRAHVGVKPLTHLMEAIALLIRKERLESKEIAVSVGQINRIRLGHGPLLDVWPHPIGPLLLTSNIALLTYTGQDGGSESLRLEREQVQNRSRERHPGFERGSRGRGGHRIPRRTAGARRNWI